MSARYSCTCSSRDFSPARPAASVPTSAASVLTLASFTSRSRCSTPAHGAFACQGHHAGSEQIYRHQHHSVVNSYIAHPLCGIRIIPHMPSWLQASKVERPVKQARTDLLCFCRAHLSRDIGKHLLTLLGAILQGHALLAHTRCISSQRSRVEGPFSPDLPDGVCGVICCGGQTHVLGLQHRPQHNVCFTRTKTKWGCAVGT